MTRMTPIHWKKFEAFLLYVGCHFEREKGDHRVYWRRDIKRPIIIPREKELPIFIIKNNLELLGIDRSQYLEILKKL